MFNFEICIKNTKKKKKLYERKLELDILAKYIKINKREITLNLITCCCCKKDNSGLTTIFI